MSPGDVDPEFALGLVQQNARRWRVRQGKPDVDPQYLHPVEIVDAAGRLRAQAQAEADAFVEIILEQVAVAQAAGAAAPSASAGARAAGLSRQGLYGKLRRR